MRPLILLAALLAVSCSSSSPTLPAGPSAPTPTSAPTPVRPADFDPVFWNEFVHDGFDHPGANTPWQRLPSAPMLYLKVIDEAGLPIDAVTLDTVQQAFVAAAPDWTGSYGLAGVERGTGSRVGQAGWLTVVWPNPSIGDVCGRSDIGVDGGRIQLNYLRPSGCGCGGSRMWPRAARHELGHAFGFYHTDRASDVMSTGFAIPTCDQVASDREKSHARLAYQTPNGARD